MPYTPHTWIAGDSATAARLNNIETSYTEATNSFEQDLFTAFVYSGLVCTKDGTIANQLDVTAGVAFLLQTDGTLRRRAPTSSTQVTATPSTTYYLDLNPDGTWSWGTSHSAVTGHLTICSATTDGSGNILVVTDARPLNTTLLTSMAGGLTIPGAFTAASFATLGTIAAGALVSGNPSFAVQSNGVAKVYGTGVINGANGYAYLAQLLSVGGGAPGQHVWEGTTDPTSSAAEGDIWIKG